MKNTQHLSQALLLGSIVFSSCAAARAQDPIAIKEAKKIVISFEIDDGPIRIVINGKDVDVQLDGEPIAADRVEVNDNFVQIKNKNGWPVAVGNFAKSNFGFNFVDAPKMHAWLGVDLRPVSDALATHMDLDQDSVSQIVSVTPESPAEEDGLREHDIILEIDGEGPATGDRLREILGEKEPGDELRLSILRRGSEEEVVVELGESQSSPWGGLSLSGDSPFFFNKGSSLYTNPNTNFTWGTAKNRYNNLLKLNNQVYRFQDLENAKGLNQLFWNKAKNKDEDADGDAEKDDGKKGDKKKGGSYAVLSPNSFFQNLNLSKDGGFSTYSKLLKDGKNQTYVLPEEDALRRIYTINQAEGQGADLAEQLAKMSKELETLKALLEKQQAKGEKKDH